MEAYFESDRGVRSELIGILRKIPSDPEEFEIYKAGVRFDEWMRDNFAVSDEYGGDFYHQVMNGLGSAMPLMVAAVLTGGASIPGTAAAAMRRPPPWWARHRAHRLISRRKSAEVCRWRKR